MSTGSSVVHITRTFILRMMLQAEKSSRARSSLVVLQISPAVSGPKSLSVMPKGFFSSMWVQGYITLPMVKGTVPAQAMYFS